MPQGSPAAGVKYLDGEDVILTANRIFGYGGWSWRSDAPYLVQESDAPGKEVWACRGDLTIAGATVTGIGTNQRSGPGAPALEMAFKGAATDALKRAFVHWGDQFGLILREKVSDSSLQKIYDDYWRHRTGTALGGAPVPTAPADVPAIAVSSENHDEGEDPGIAAYRKAHATLEEMGWKWGDEHVTRVLGRKPTSGADARDALSSWLTAVKGRTPDIFLKQISQQHQRMSREVK